MPTTNEIYKSNFNSAILYGDRVPRILLKMNNGQTLSIFTAPFIRLERMQLDIACPNEDTSDFFAVYSFFIPYKMATITGIFYIKGHIKRQ